MSKFIRSFFTSFTIFLALGILINGSCKAQFGAPAGRPSTVPASRGMYTLTDYNKLLGTWKLVSIDELTQEKSPLCISALGVKITVEATNAVSGSVFTPERGTVTITNNTRCIEIDTCIAQAQQKPQLFLWPGTLEYLSVDGSPLRFRRNNCQVDSGEYRFTFGIRNGKPIMYWIGPKLSMIWERV